MKTSVQRDLKYLIGGAGFVILGLVGVMLFSPLSLQFNDADVGRGGDWEMEIDDLIDSNQAAQALMLVDSLIDVKSQGLPRLAYFDRYLSEDERMDATNARADIYELQWRRIELLNATNQREALLDALEEYADVIGYNQEAAEAMLKHLNCE